MQMDSNHPYLISFGVSDMDRDFQEALNRQNITVITSKSKKLWEAMKHVPTQSPILIPMYVDAGISETEFQRILKEKHADKAVTP